MPTTAAWRKARRTAGFCSMCLCRPRAEGRSMCSGCLPKANKNAKASQAKRRAAGLCVGCGGVELVSKTLCSRCKGVRMARYYQRTQAGLCQSCGVPAVVGTYCEDHWYRMISTQYRMGTNGPTILRRLWAQQGGICAITGEVLVPGGNASIDHIIPRSRGGTSDEANLQWVTQETNWYKGDRSLADLRAWCRRVVAATPHHVVAVPSLDAGQKGTGTS